MQRRARSHFYKRLKRQLRRWVRVPTGGTSPEPHAPRVPRSTHIDMRGARTQGEEEKVYTPEKHAKHTPNDFFDGDTQESSLLVWAKEWAATLLEMLSRVYRTLSELVRRYAGQALGWITSRAEQIRRARKPSWSESVYNRASAFSKEARDRIYKTYTALASQIHTMTKKKTNNKKSKRSLLAILKRIAFFAVVAFLVLGGIFFIWVATLEIPESNIDERIVAQSTKLYDQSGETLLYDVYKDERRTVVPLEDISPNMVKAIMAIEDDTFYEHNGVRPLALARAIYYKLRDPSSRLQGGSTITQQVIKNAMLTSERKIERKVKEWVLAWRLEKIKSKDEIMEIYLNEVPFGGPVYGVEQAAQSFFAKSADELTVAESAYLAALPKAPTTYLNDRERFDGRARFIMKRMRDLGFISQAQYEEALEQEIVFVEQVDKGIKAPHFVFYVQDQLEEELIEGVDDLSQNGYRVRTTLNWDLQQQIESVVATHTERITTNYNASNLAVVVIENETGKIRAMVGSKDYFAEDIDGNFNITTAFRQPGSTFKPLVYSYALSQGYTPETIIWDAPTEFSQACYPDGEPRPGAREADCYSPQNYDQRFRGPLTMRSALAQSLNIPAVKMLYMVGVGNAMDFAQDLGITSLTKAPSFYGLNLVLGGGEVRMIDMASAYSTFANDGVRHDLAVWEEVTDSRGEVLDEYEDYKEQVMSANAARMINDILSDNDAKRPMFGTYSRLYYEDGRDVAVKTGTTNNFRDVWTAGYSKEVTVVVWAGNNDNTPIGNAPSSSVVGPFWRDAMDAALEYYNAPAFSSYSIENYESLKPILRGNYEGGAVYVDTQTGEVVANPSQEEIELGLVERTGGVEYHSLLHYIDRNDVRGPAPSNPGSDGLYEHFEYGVAFWTDQQGWESTRDSNTIDSLLDQIRDMDGGADIPDDWFGGGDTPDEEVVEPEPVASQSFDFEIESPANKATVDGSQELEISLNILGRERDIDTIYYYFNNSYLGSGSSRQTSWEVRPDSVRGVEESNTIRVIVELENGDRVEKNHILYVEQF